MAITDNSWQKRTSDPQWETGLLLQPLPNQFQLLCVKLYLIFVFCISVQLLILHSILFNIPVVFKLVLPSVIHVGQKCQIMRIKIENHLEIVQRHKENNNKQMQKTNNCCANKSYSYLFVRPLVMFLTKII